MNFNYCIWHLGTAQIPKTGIQEAYLHTRVPNSFCEVTDIFV